MVSGVSVTSLANRALLAVGSRSKISNIDEDDSPAANAVNTLWLPTYQSLARAAWWNCFRKQASLTLLKSAQGTPQNPTGTLPNPPSPWLYEYLLPADCLHARYVVPTLPVTGTGTVPLTTINNNAPTMLPTDGQIPFIVAYDTDPNNNPLSVVLTNQGQAQMTYTVNQPNPSIWDSQFQAAFVASLAAFLVPALTLHLPLMQLQIKLAEEIIGEARAADGNEGSSSQNRDAVWMTARAGSSTFGYGNTLYGFPNYMPVTWPAY